VEERAGFFLHLSKGTNRSALGLKQIGLADCRNTMRTRRLDLQF
jgi:hypothetical protein